MRGTPTVPASSTRALRVAVTGRRRPSKGEAGTVVGRFGTRGIPTCPSCNLYDERGRIPNGGDSGTGGCATLPRPRWARCCSSFSSNESRERTSWCLRRMAAPFSCWRKALLHAASSCWAWVGLCCDGGVNDVLCVTSFSYVGVSANETDRLVGVWVPSAFRRSRLELSLIHI